MKCALEITKRYFTRNFCDGGSLVESLPFQLRGGGADNRSIRVINAEPAGKPLHGTYKIKKSLVLHCLTS